MAEPSPTASGTDGSPAPQGEQCDSEEVLPLTTFTPAMFVEAQEDFTQPPPPLAPTVTARLEEALAGIDSHAKAVQENMFSLVAREKNRLHQEVGKRMKDAPVEMIGRLSMVSKEGEEKVLDHLQAPGLVLFPPDYKHLDYEEVVQVQRRAVEEAERFRELDQGDQSRFEVCNITRHHLEFRNAVPFRTPPRDYCKARSLDVVYLAMQNLEGYAEQVPYVKDMMRKAAADNIRENLSAMAPPANNPSTVAAGEPMDID
ncbi:hypothetical protein DL769_011449 [Monosporascus sp. CRB-8-3]|nr:hypothetical protein DL769_011449 [Monosporascus sp. CRB-8-3]